MFALCGFLVQKSSLQKTFFRPAAMPRENFRKAEEQWAMLPEVPSLSRCLRAVVPPKTELMPKW